MASIVDVAEYILERQGPMSSMKLQRLCYYSHAWHLAWDGEALFDNEIHAWANGPVVPDLYELHKGTFKLHPGMVQLAAKAKAARVKVSLDPDRGEDGMWTWAVPNLIWGGPDVTGVGSSPRQCADDGRAALRRLYELGMEMLKVKPWSPPEDDGRPDEVRTRHAVRAVDGRTARSRCARLRDQGLDRRRSSRNPGCARRHRPCRPTHLPSGRPPREAPDLGRRRPRHRPAHLALNLQLGPSLQ